MKKSVAVLSMALVLLVSGCAKRISQNHYSEDAAGEVSQSYRGVIISARKVEVGKEKLGDNTMGLAAGGIGGALLGSQIGSGTKAGIVGAVAGGLIAATAGAFLEDALTSQSAMDYSVQLDNGQVMSVVQGDDEVYAVGQRVLLIKSAKRSRIIADRSPAPAKGTRAAKMNDDEVIAGSNERVIRIKTS